MDPGADDGTTAGSDFPTAWRHVVTEPRAFFAAMPEAGGLGEPMRFLAVCAGIDATGTFVVTWSLFQAVAAFCGVVAGGFVLAAVLTLVTQHLFEGRAGFEPVFRAVAYGAAPSVLFWVPRLATVAYLYAWFLQTRGVERIQEVDPTRAAVATALSWAAVALVARGLAGYSPL